MNTHKECQNFNITQSWCILKKKQVDPNGEACDQFIPITGA